MKRPGPVTASIVVMSIAVFFGIVLAIVFVPAASSGGTIQRENSSFAAMIITLALPFIAAVTDLVLLFVRKKWSYYFNLAVIGLFILFFAFAILAFTRIATKNIPSTFRILSLIYLAPIGLLVWLFVELIIRASVKDYFNKADSAKTE